MDELRLLAEGRFGDMVKAVVDVKRSIMLLDADLHADLQKYFDAYARAARRAVPPAPLT